MPDTKNEYGIQGEDEIDLYPYWLAIKKRWLMIVFLTLAGVAGAYIATRYMPRIYRANALISLGRIESGGRVSTVANLADINQMIESGSLQKKIAESFKAKYPQETISGSALRNNLSAQASDKSEYIALKFDFANPELGVQVLNKFIQELQKTFDRRTENARKSVAAEIARKKNEIGNIEFQKGKLELKLKQLEIEIQRKKELTRSAVAVLTNQKAALADQIKNYEQRIGTLAEAKNQLNALTASLEANTNELVKGKSELTQASTGEGLLASVLFSNNLQQNIYSLSLNKQKINEYDMLANDARKEINLLKIELALTEGKIKETTLLNETEIDKFKAMMDENKLELEKSLPAEIEKVQNDIQVLEARKDMIEGIEVIAEADYLGQAIKPKTMMIVAGGGFIAFLFSIFLAFFRQWQECHLNNGTLTSTEK